MKSRSLLFALLVSSFGTSYLPAHAQSLTVQPPTEGQSLEAGRAYLVRYACKIADTSQNHAGLLDFLGIGSNNSAIHGIYIQKSQPTGAANGEFGSSADTLAAVHIYTHSKVDPENNFDGVCDNEFLVSGSETPYLLAFLSKSNKNNSELLQGTATFVSAAIPTLFSLVTGVSLPGVDVSRLQSTQRVVDNWSSFLNIFNDSEAWSKAYRLRTGQYAVKTDISSAVVAVSRQDHLLTGRSPFKKGLADVLSRDAALLSADLASDETLTAKCTSIASSWAKVGVRAPEDQAYVLYLQLQKVNATKQQILTCIGPARAAASIPHLDLFDMPAELAFTEDDLEPESDLSPTWGMQPRSWRDLGPTMKQLVRRLGTKPNGLDSLLADTRNQLADIFASEFSFSDDTIDYAVIQAVLPNSEVATIRGEPIGVLQQLSRAGFQRWGCYLLTGGPDGAKFRSPENEVVILLLWKAGISDELTAETPAYVVRVYFDGRKIANLTVTDELTPVDVAIAAECTARPSFSVQGAARATEAPTSN